MGHATGSLDGLNRGEQVMLILVIHGLNIAQLDSASRLAMLVVDCKSNVVAPRTSASARQDISRSVFEVRRKLSN